jgi:hypothetical protein
MRSLAAAGVIAAVTAATAQSALQPPYPTQAKPVYGDLSCLQNPSIMTTRRLRADAICREADGEVVALGGDLKNDVSANSAGRFSGSNWPRAPRLRSS